MADESTTGAGVPWMKVVLIALGIVAVIIACVAIYKYHLSIAKSQPMLIDRPSLMTIANVPPSNVPELSANGREYTYNFWINVNDWSKGYGQVKHVLTRSNDDPSRGLGKVLTNPTIWLYPTDNKIAIRVSTMKSNSDSYDKSVFPKYETMNAPHTNHKYTVVNPYYYHKKDANMKQYLDTTVVCDIANIPLQRWVMVSVILWNRTMDVYINGMLVRSAVLPGIPYFRTNGLKNIYVGDKRPGHTFNGHISRLKYYNRAITAKEVMGLYESGPLPAAYWWNNLKQNIKVTLDVTSE
jgi:hypothetical protein